MAVPVAARALFPVLERAFTYRRYASFLDSLVSADLDVLPLRELLGSAGRRPTLGLRHDVDERLDSALTFAELEHARGLRATYFVLHTASYWERDDFLGRLQLLQELGHEVGLHHDVVTIQVLKDVDVGPWLEDELRRLRDAGIDIRGAAAHGSFWANRLGFHNNYAFEGWDEPLNGFPSTTVREKLDPTQLGLEYEAYHLGVDRYFSDAMFLNRRRWHPSQLDLRSFRPDERVVVNIHPCHWDASAAAKVPRLARRVARRALRQSRRAPVFPPARAR